MLHRDYRELIKVLLRLGDYTEIHGEILRNLRPVLAQDILFSKAATELTAASSLLHLTCDAAGLQSTRSLKAEGPKPL